MSLKGYFVDDTESDKKFARLLSVEGAERIDFSFEEVTEAAALARKLFDSKPDIIALDFRLDECLMHVSPAQSYRASSLAQMLRDLAVSEPLLDFPIVLVSAEPNYERIYRPDKTAHDLFDRFYTKERIAEGDGYPGAELVALCHGYSLLKDFWAHSRTDRLGVFALGDQEREIVDVQELRQILNDAAAPHIAARAILRGVIDRAGLLLSDEDVAARLGIANSEIPKLLSKLEEVQLQYKGIFHEGWRRWWAHRFDSWAESLFGRRPANLIGTERAGIISKKLGVDVASATSTWNKSPNEKFSFSCASCKRPAEVRHSLTAFDPHAPGYAQRRRICWDCIQTGRYKDIHLSVDDVDASFVPKIEELDRSQDFVDHDFVDEA